MFRSKIINLKSQILRSAEHLIAEVLAQILRGAEVNPPPTKQRRKLGLKGGQPQQARRLARLKFQQQIDLI